MIPIMALGIGIFKFFMKINQKIIIILLTLTIIFIGFFTFGTQRNLKCIEETSTQDTIETASTINQEAPRIEFLPFKEWVGKKEKENPGLAEWSRKRMEDQQKEIMKLQKEQRERDGIKEDIIYESPPFRKFLDEYHYGEFKESQNYEKDPQ